MIKFGQDKYYRLIDANLNRTKEGLRVCEDICRFLLDDSLVTSQWKTIRHKVTEITKKSPWRLGLKARDIEKDVGRRNHPHELRRKNVSDVFYANVQRSKESVRVLEELMKLKNKSKANDLKNIRYRIYALEKKTSGRL